MPLRFKISTVYCFVSGEFPLFLKQAIHAARIDFVKEPGVLRVISRDPSSQRRSAMLQEMHFRNIAQRSNLRKRTEEAARHLEATRLQVLVSLTPFSSLEHNASIFLEGRSEGRVVDMDVSLGMRCCPYSGPTLQP